MSTVQLTKNWSAAGSITPNLRRAYVSLNDLAGWFIYENTQILSSKWTRVWESNGTTGPASDGDTTQRLTSVAACSVRGASDTAAQSWGVYEASDGSQLLIAYQGATDDVVRIGYSRTGVYTRAGTATHQPTATDELVLSTGNSMVNATTSADRVMSIWCIDSDWRCAIFRSNAIVNILGLGHMNPLVSTRLVNPIFDPPYLAWRLTGANRTNSGGHPMAFTGTIGLAAYAGLMARVYTDTARNIRCGGGDIGGTSSSGYQSPGTFIADRPALQNGEGSVLLPMYVQGERTTNCDGFLCTTVDWWMAYASANTVPALGDFFAAWDHDDDPGTDPTNSDWLVALGSGVVWPWRAAAGSMEIA